MTKLLKEAIQKLSKLPAGRQDELARMLIDVAASDLQSTYQNGYRSTTGIKLLGLGVLSLSRANVRFCTINGPPGPHAVSGMKGSPDARDKSSSMG